MGQNILKTFDIGTFDFMKPNSFFPKGLRDAIERQTFIKRQVFRSKYYL